MLLCVVMIYIDHLPTVLFLFYYTDFQEKKSSVVFLGHIYTFFHEHTIFV